MTDFSSPILGLDGEPQQRPGKTTAETIPVTLGWLCREALAAELQEDRGKGGADKIARIQLALRIPLDGEAALSAPEITLICERIGQAFPAIATYRAVELLDPARLAR